MTSGMPTTPTRPRTPVSTPGKVGEQTVRADGAKGAWSHQYRFETVRGGARFRFRARIRRQAGYPFATGNSRTIRVSVHGL